MVSEDELDQLDIIPVLPHAKRDMTELLTEGSLDKVGLLDPILVSVRRLILVFRLSSYDFLY